MTVLDPYVFKGRFEYDPDMGFRIRAYYPTGLYDEASHDTVTNRFGFNAPDYPLAKTPGTFRILFVGDSFGWAGGLKGNYIGLLQQTFDAQNDSRRIEIINTGYPGTHTGEQLIMLRKFGLQYDPDLVILGFFAGNDFSDADPYRKRIVLNDSLYDIDRRNELRLLGYPIVLQSRAYIFLQQKYAVYARNRQSKKEALEWARVTGQPAPTNNLTEQTFYAVQNLKLKFFNKHTSDEEFRPNIELIFRSIAEMDELLKARHIPLLVAIYPDEMQVSRSQFETLVQRFGLNADDYDLDLAEKRLRGFLDTKGIPYIDLLDRFRAEEEKQDLYYFRNTHWNQNGNRLAEEMIFDYLNNSSEGRKLMSH
jgi:hypothetical protein